MKQQATTAVDWECDSETYHHDTSKIGHSMYETFVKSQSLYHAIYVAKTKPVPPPSKDLLLGIWTHLALLEPHKWASEYCFDLPPLASDGLEWNWRKPSHREERDALKVYCPNMLEPDDRFLVEAMRDAVLKNADARTLIDLPGLIEHGYYWQDESGLFLKSRPDKIIGNVMPDLKTCGDASPECFANTCRKFGYHRTAAWRIDGHKAMTGHDARYLFIAVSKETLDVGVHELSEAEIELGRRQNRLYLNRLAKCYETGDWSPWWSKQVNTLRYPPYAFTNEWEIDE